MNDLSELRKKLKPSKVSDMESQDHDLDAKLGRKDSKYGDKLRITEGANLFRIMPPHEPETKDGYPNPFAEPLVVCYIPAMVTERDSDGKPMKNGDSSYRTKLGMKPVYSSLIHGRKNPDGTPIAQDLIEEYRKIGMKRAAEMSENDAKEFLKPIKGQFSRDPKSNFPGLSYRQSWAVYALQVKGESMTFGLLEFGKAVKNRLNKIAALEAANDPIGTDPFTDLDEGRAVRVVYNSQASKPEDYYQTDLDSTQVDEMIGGRKVKVLKTYPITDEQLQAFSEVEPLEKIYRNAFSKTDFNIQLEGLRLFDTQYKCGIFDTEEFLSIAEEIGSHYQDEETDNGVVKPSVPLTTEETTTTPAKVEPKVAEPVDGEDDMFSDMDRDEMKDFSKDNQTGIIVLGLAKMSDKDLRTQLRQWLASRSLTTEEKEQPKTEPVSAPVEKTLTARERLEALKKRSEV